MLPLFQTLFSICPLNNFISSKVFCYSTILFNLNNNNLIIVQRIKNIQFFLIKNGEFFQIPHLVLFVEVITVCKLIIKYFSIISYFFIKLSHICIISRNVIYFVMFDKINLRCIQLSKEI